MEPNESIFNVLKNFYDEQNVPHLLFYGKSGMGKKTLVEKFLYLIYKKKETINKYVMCVNCAHGKGIKFIRDELKFFAKTNINHMHGYFFKSIVLLNAEKLTIDAQSALRRCIENFSAHTRFFFVLENKSAILKPILSRLCEIYVNDPNLKKNLYSKKIESYKYSNTRLNYLKKYLETTFKKDNTYIETVEHLYEKGYNCIDLINIIHKLDIDYVKQLQIKIYFDKIKKEFRNEKLLLLNLLIFLRSSYNLENIVFI
jgi:DNA polymerase III delta prime subunit